MNSNASPSETTTPVPAGSGTGVHPPVTISPTTLSGDTALRLIGPGPGSEIIIYAQHRDGGTESGPDSSASDGWQANVAVDDLGNPVQPNSGWMEYPSEECARFDALVDIGLRDGRPVFMVRHANGEARLTRAVKRSNEDVLLITPSPGAIMWKLSKAEDVLGHFRVAKDCLDGAWEGELFDLIVGYIRRGCRLPSDAHYVLIAAWIMHTYLMHRFAYSPILFFFGSEDRGKTRTCKSILSLSYRGYLTSSVAEAQLIRLASRFGDTLGIDVRDFWGKVKSHRSEDVVLDRFERGKAIVRVRTRERGQLDELAAYDVFGPTIICTNTPLPPVYGSRGVEIINPVSDGSFAEIEIAGREATSIRARLLAFRLKHFDSPLPETPPVLTRRFADIMKPLHQIVRLVSPGNEGDFVALVNDLDRARRLEKAESVEGDVIKALWAARPNIERGKLAVVWVAKAFNEGKTGRDCISERSLGWQLRGLGFGRDRNSRGYAAIRWDGDQLARLAEAHGVELAREETNPRAEA